MHRGEIPGHREFSDALGAVALIVFAWFLLMFACQAAHGQSTAYLPPPEKFCRYDGNGDPLVGGLLYTYSAGTTTNKATYKDALRAATNTNPVVLDSSGCADVWLGSGSYKFKLTDVNGSLLWTVDNITSSAATWGSITGTLSNQTDLQAALDAKIPLSYLDTDITLAANSNVRIASQKATKAYAVPQTRTLTTTAPLKIDGVASADLSSNRTLSIDNFTGDSGSGGAKGAVPAPASGDAAANKYLRADGTWAALVSGGSGVRAATISSPCTTGSSSYSACASPMTITWSTAFADTTYKVTCTGITPSDGRAGQPYVVTKATNTITVNFVTNGSLAVTYASIDCIAIP